VLYGGTASKRGSLIRSPHAHVARGLSDAASSCDSKKPSELRGSDGEVTLSGERRIFFFEIWRVEWRACPHRNGVFIPDSDEVE
jgi:hypothetical protein